MITRGITAPELARRLAVDESTVRQGVRTGRLSASLLRARGRLRFDPDRAVKEWTANRGTTRVELDGGVSVDIGLAGARKAVLVAQAKRIELDYAKRAGELVELVKVEASRAAEVVRVRDLILGLAARLKQRLPHLTAADLVEVDRYARELCEELATGTAREAAGNWTGSTSDCIIPRIPDDSSRSA